MTGPGLSDLRADCASCVGLCCVALPFSRSSDFAFDKAAGDPCRHLAEDRRCSIHATLREDGMRGCTVYDCFGAGQRLTAAGVELAGVRLPVVRDLHEILWLLGQASTYVPDGALADELAAVRADVDAAAGDLGVGPDDVTLHRQLVGGLLARVSDEVRVPAGSDLGRADLAGRSWRGADLVRANLRGSLLLEADLSGADLDRADLLGADLRGADVRGARLAGSLFLTQVQVNAALGDARTTLPPELQRPGHWG
jgi:uncharacterized protein YjbI with pentapeptide repeats